MPTAEQNALVQSRCAVCHDDSHPNGGLSLQHFDAAHTSPSLAAIMLSKLRNGALGASGAKLPDKAVEQAFTDAFIAQSAGADHWFVERGSHENAALITASILHELPHARGKNKEDSAVYRVIVSCDPSTRKGQVQLAWSPEPRAGQLMISVDGKRPTAVLVAGKEKMGNGSGVESGPASVFLTEMIHSPLPESTLRISDLFPNESVDFGFDLPSAARKDLSACFGRR